MSEGGELVEPQPCGYSLTIRIMLSLAHTAPRLICGEGVIKRAIAELACVIALRLVEGGANRPSSWSMAGLRCRVALLIKTTASRSDSRAPGATLIPYSRPRRCGVHVFGQLRRHFFEVLVLAELPVAHPVQERLLSQRNDRGIRLTRAAPPAHVARFFAKLADEDRPTARAYFLFGLAVKPLTDKERPREEAYRARFTPGIVQRDVDDEC